MKIIYKTEIIPEIEEIIDLYNFSDYFPIADKNDIERIKKMHHNANIVVTAWDNNKLVGLARSISDFCYCCYLSDLCVRDDYKGNGIGKELVNITKTMAGDECKLILQSSPNAIGFYSTIGMEQIDSAFIIKRSH
ncbi:GNAT family N-acetyltransferase [Chryseobacterium paridis]|uniref:GNAT family N-acetyltransferase n=1 Tax=Chryseobacterium paridis TaxID=2800328 RepID=A0ABS1FX23_9FLAO|nr:GNAT family N-acetyltransferase [Chryseobacterium paridis]MBK1896749.1 GNAT family N-acetyltransferase [Chryseobacterium paridis]